ncbi:DUF4012 domain-containing protein [Microbacterium karelineae]|uniref:DUF4012 domain-containing protein n=1 Tax=Microbacterium karelineae TaxID=2654283 RepID=UPI0012E99859|nr:DUF4012 domain-containing protein [Microbacterium karelineae]
MQQPDENGAGSSATRPWWRRRPRAKAVAWTIVGVLAFCIVVMGVSAVVAKLSVDSLMAESRQLAKDLGDAEATADHVDSMIGSARAAHIATSHPVWRATEILPIVGDDLRAVRLLAGAADELIADVAAPLLEFDLASVGPTDGALNVDAVAELGTIIEDVAPVAEGVQVRLIAEGVDASTLLEPLQDPVTTVTEGIDGAAQVLRRLAILSPQLPTMLGADEPRDYLVLVQNTAEMRTLGGNPGNFLMLTIDDGRMAITNQGNRFNMNTRRDAPIVPLDPWTEELYGDKVGKFFQDITMTPDFAQTAHLARAFWSETLGDPGDAVLAIDPTVLSYLLKATGPVELPTGETLNAGNVVEQLLSRVYWRFPGGTNEDGRKQDEFFGLAAATIFTEVTSAEGGLTALLPQLAKGFEEGRILYAATDAREVKAIDGTLFQGPLYDASNAQKTTMGVFVNDNTEGKLDYYTEMSVVASSDVCQADEAPTFIATATYDYNLQPEEVADLPQYVSTARYFPKGVKSTNLVFYGPVGSTYVSATVDGEEYIPVAGTNDQGRAAVKILIENQPATSHEIEVTFRGVEGEQYGPLDVAHTPMIKDVPVEIDAPGCAAQ